MDMTMTIPEVARKSKELVDEVSTIIVGKKNILKYLVLGAITDGHILFEDYPGLAKTLTIKTFAQATGCTFTRVQFTPDLLPADITGTYVYTPKNNDFKLIKGPIFTNILLADEINRAPPKTQAALLEAMQERQTTLEGETYRLERPFLVLATQNPIEYEGTYPLPEAQIDRFLIKLTMGYPTHQDEYEMLLRTEQEDLFDRKITKIITPREILDMQKSLQQVHLDNDLKKYIVTLVQHTRIDPRIDVGISPRGSIATFKLAKAHAAFYGRTYVVPDDIKTVAIPALAHRLILKPETRIRGIKPDAIIQELIQTTPVPKTG